MNIFAKTLAASFTLSVTLLPSAINPANTIGFPDSLNPSRVIGASWPASCPQAKQLTADGQFLFWPSGSAVAIPRRFDPPAQPWLPGHRGVDLAMRAGDQVFSATAGTVIFAGDLAGRGVVSVQDAAGLHYTYEPVTPLVGVGDVVSRGQILAILDPGHSPSGDRLHFGVKCGPKTYLDPALLLGAQIRLLPWE